MDIKIFIKFQNFIMKLLLIKKTKNIEKVRAVEKREFCQRAGQYDAQMKQQERFN